MDLAEQGEQNCLLRLAQQVDVLRSKAEGAVPVVVDYPSLHLELPLFAPRLRA